MVVGFVLIAEGLFFLISSTRRVTGYVDGRFVLVSGLRTLEVSPGELKSIRCIWLDPNRLGPMRVRSASGSILIFPRIPGAEDRFAALQRANPAARITSPRPFRLRGWSSAPRSYR